MNLSVSIIAQNIRLHLGHPAASGSLRYWKRVYRANRQVRYDDTLPDGVTVDVSGGYPSAADEGAESGAGSAAADAAKTSSGADDDTQPGGVTASSSADQSARSGMQG